MSEKNEVLLEIEKLCCSFGSLKAVDQVSFVVRRGQIKALIGPNGAGKTTLFNLVCGSQPASGGAVFFRGHYLNGIAPHAIAALGLARTFQTTKLFGHMSVLENIMVGRHTRSRAGFINCLLNLPSVRREEKVIRAQAAEILDLVGMGNHSAELTGNLAFGQQRLIEIARALAQEPALLLLDEPAAGLNIYETTKLAQLIRKIQERGVTVLLVEHDMSLVMDISDEIVVLNRGRWLAEGPPRAIQHNPQVIKVYLGED